MKEEKRTGYRVSEINGFANMKAGNYPRRTNISIVHHEEICLYLTPL